MASPLVERLRLSAFRPQTWPGTAPLSRKIELFATTSGLSLRGSLGSEDCVRFLTESKLFLAFSRASRQLSLRVDVNKDAFEHELEQLGVVLDSTVLFTHCAICVDDLQSTLLTPIDKFITYLGPMSLNLGPP